MSGSAGKMENKVYCEVCEREVIGARCIAFVPTSEGISYPTGYNVLMCMECYLSFLAQFMEMSNRELTDYLKWLGGLK